jgi:hypothetical protein
MEKATFSPFIQGQLFRKGNRINNLEEREDMKDPSRRRAVGFCGRIFLKSLSRRKHPRQTRQLMIAAPLHSFIPDEHSRVVDISTAGQTWLGLTGPPGHARLLAGKLQLQTALLSSDKLDLLTCFWPTAKSRATDHNSRDLSLPASPADYSKDEAEPPLACRRR